MTIASRLSESPAEQARLLEDILERGNMRQALKRVTSNKGAPGIDGMSVEHLRGYLRRHLSILKKNCTNFTELKVYHPAFSD